MLRSSIKCEAFGFTNGVLNSYDVIKIVMTDFIKSGTDIHAALKKLSMRILDDLVEKYPEVKYDSEDLSYSMDRFYRKSNIPFVIIIDEWDAVFRECKEDKDGQKFYLDFLRDWLKDKEYVALAYMTGILPIKKYGKHSSLNMFDEYSIIAPMQLAPYTGFTEEEAYIPNQEILDEFKASTKSEEWLDAFASFRKSQELLQATWDGTEVKVA